jgi:transposase
LAVSSWPRCEAREGHRRLTEVETCKLNGIEAEAYLRDVLTRIAEHPINRLAELLPWH